MAGLGEVMRGRRCEPLIMRHHRKHDELEALLFDVAEGRARQLIEKMGRDAPRAGDFDDIERADLDELAVLVRCAQRLRVHFLRSEEHTSELQSLMRISYAVF